MTIEPDTKSWTWVIERPCPECGFDARLLSYDDVPEQIRANAARWPAVLARPDPRVRRREGVWSDLEYAAHVRDVFRIFRTRLDAMLAHDGADFENWDQDATAVAERYGEQDPAQVAVELIAAAHDLAATFASVPPAERGRRGRRSDGSSFTVETLALYLLHDPVHHLSDVSGGPEGA